MKAISNKITIMGIDPGTNTTGYGVIEISGGVLRCVVMGEIDLRKMECPYRKLHHIFERVCALVDEYCPDEVALESPFFGENVQSMLKLGRAQGVAMAAALSRGCSVAEYAPRRIKQAITGRGSATKEQVAAMLSSMMKFEALPKRLDATDGLAVAVCHHFQRETTAKFGAPENKKKALGGGCASQSWGSFISANPKRIINK